MFELICVLITAFITGAALHAYYVMRDPLHPAIFMAPLFVYFYGVWPIVLNRDGQLAALISENYLEHSALVFLLCIMALYVGLLSGVRRVRRMDERNPNSSAALLAITSNPQKLFLIALLLGGASLVVYIISLENVGGFYAAYSREKGEGYLSSGYLGEALLLTYPSLLTLALSVRARGKKINFVDIVTALVIALPHLIQGTLGGRRGPLFLILSTLLFSWLIAKGRKPSLKTIVVAVGIIGFSVVLTASQRHYLYLGSGGDFEASRVFEADGLAPEQIDSGNSYLTAVAMIVTADYFGDYYWGYRYFVTFFIRPIPKILWPTKYTDMNATWLNELGGSVYGSKYGRALGIRLLAGSSGGSIADGYVEFSYGVILMFFIIGRAFATVYKSHRLNGGFWTVLFYIMIALSIYLPTQSFSAWLIRVLYIAFIGYVSWRFVIGRVSPRLNQ